MSLQLQQIPHCLSASECVCVCVCERASKWMWMSVNVCELYVQYSICVYSLCVSMSACALVFEDVK